MSVVLAKYKYKIVNADASSAVFSDAYRYYAALLELVPQEYAELLHCEDFRPVAQYLYYDRQLSSLIWSVSLMTEEICSVFGSVLKSDMTLSLHPERVELSLLSEEKYESAASFVDYASKNPVLRNSVSLRFVTPVVFKQNGKYVIYPHERMLVNSLVGKWDSVFPDFPLNDSDAVNMLVNGINITDYDLKTYRFRLKGASVPGCRGTVKFYVKLSEPMFELWNLLLHFSEFCGIGAKTTLGMGGVIPGVDSQKTKSSNTSVIPAP